MKREKVERKWKAGVYNVRTLSGHTGPILCLQFDTHKVISGSGHRDIKIWDIERKPKGQKLKKLQLNSSLSSSCPSPKKKLKTSGGGSQTKQTVSSLHGHRDAVYCLQYNHQILVSGSADKTIKIWNHKKRQELRQLSGHSDSVMCLQFQDNTLITGGADRN